MTYNLDNLARDTGVDPDDIQDMYAELFPQETADVLDADAVATMKRHLEAEGYYTLRNSR